MASWSVLAAVDGLLLRGCVVACETDRSAQAKSVEYLTRFVHTLPLADTPLGPVRRRCELGVRAAPDGGRSKLGVRVWFSSVCPLQ